MGKSNKFYESFTLSDTFIYYTDIRLDAKEKHKQSGIPIKLQFDEISTTIQEYSPKFQDDVIQKMICNDYGTIKLFSECPNHLSSLHLICYHNQLMIQTKVNID